MKEKIEQTNFDELTSEGANELLTELLTYVGDEFKELVVTVIDTIEYSSVSENKMNSNIEILFNNDRVKEVIDGLLDDYDTED